jgi:Lar family restriction alleviation protein
MSERELLPCPFCDGRPRLVAPVWDLLPYCECLRCGVKTTMATTNAEAIAAWNRRSPSRQSILEEAAKERDRLREALEWALDEIDVLSNKIVQFAYPQGMAMMDREDQWERHFSARSALSHDGKAPAKEGDAG